MKVSSKPCSHISSIRGLLPDAVVVSASPFHIGAVGILPLGCVCGKLQAQFVVCKPCIVTVRQQRESAVPAGVVKRGASLGARSNAASDPVNVVAGAQVEAEVIQRTDVIGVQRQRRLRPSYLRQRPAVQAAALMLLKTPAPDRTVAPSATSIERAADGRPDWYWVRWHSAERGRVLRLLLQDRGVAFSGGWTLPCSCRRSVSQHRLDIHHCRRTGAGGANLAVTFPWACRCRRAGSFNAMRAP